VRVGALGPAVAGKSLPPVPLIAHRNLLLRRRTPSAAARELRVVPAGTTPSPCFAFHLTSCRGVLIELWRVGDEILVHSGEGATVLCSCAAAGYLRGSRWASAVDLSWMARIICSVSIRGNSSWPLIGRSTIGDWSGSLLIQSADLGSVGASCVPVQMRSNLIWVVRSRSSGWELTVTLRPRTFYKRDLVLSLNQPAIHASVAWVMGNFWFNPLHFSIFDAQSRKLIKIRKIG
jgi:hypothetical protein